MVRRYFINIGLLTFRKCCVLCVCCCGDGVAVRYTFCCNVDRVINVLFRVVGEAARGGGGRKRVRLMNGVKGRIVVALRNRRARS